MKKSEQVTFMVHYIAKLEKVAEAAKKRVGNGWHNDTCQMEIFGNSDGKYPCNCGQDELTEALRELEEK